MKFFSLFLSVCFLASVLSASKSMSVSEKVRLMGRVLNQVDTVIDYEPCRDGRIGHVGMPVFVGDSFFVDAKIKEAVIASSLALMRNFVLNDSAAYYPRFTLYFIGVTHADKSFKLDYNDSGVHYSRRAMSLEERYEALTSMIGGRKWLIRSLQGPYCDRKLGFELSDEMGGVKLSDWEMNRHAVDLGQLVYEFVLDRKKTVVPMIPISFTDATSHDAGQNSTVFYRLFCMKDIDDDASYAFR